MKTKKKILIICAVGTNRSRYLANYLRRKGYSTRYGGIAPKWPEGANPLKPEHVDWADIVIIVRKRLKPIFKKRFPKFKKKLIVFDISDSKRLAPEEFQKYEGLEFQKKWTYPRLRKAVNEALK